MVAFDQAHIRKEHARQPPNWKEYACITCYLQMQVGCCMARMGLTSCSTCQVNSCSLSYTLSASSAASQQERDKPCPALLSSTRPPARRLPGTPAGLIILGGTACAAVPILVLRHRRKHRPPVLPLGESLNKLPSFSH
jgi:hypothetical protein